MPTRAQRAAAEKAAAKVVLDQNPSAQVDASTIAKTSDSDIQAGSATEAIGNRLRKRRRTDSSLVIVDETPPPKRSKPERSALPPARRGRAIEPAPDIPTTSKVELRNDTDNTGQDSETFPGDSWAADYANVDSQDRPEELPIPSQPVVFGQLPAAPLLWEESSAARADPVDQNEIALNMVDTESFLRLGASQHLKIQSLPILDNLATQILNTLAKSSFHEIIAIAIRPDADPGQAYVTLKSLFEHTKKIYSTHDPFLNPHQLGLLKNTERETIRKSNMATFVSSVIGSQDVGFYHLNENFLDTFIPDTGRLLKSQGQIFLELKTQAYISAVNNGNRNGEEILEDLFPHDLEARLLRRRPGATQLGPSETEFIQRARNRRKALQEESIDNPNKISLSEKYIWEDFLKDVCTYVSKNFYIIAGLTPKKIARPGRTPGCFGVLTPGLKQQPTGQAVDSQQKFQGQHFNMESQQGQLQRPNGTIDPRLNGSSVNENDVAGKAALAALQTFNGDATATSPSNAPRDNPTPGINSTSASRQESMQQKPPEIQYHFEHALHPNVPAPPPPQFLQQIPYQHPQHRQQHWQGHMMGVGQLHQSYSDQQLIPYPTQTAPTQVLYERARMATTTKASPNNRRTGNTSQRRQWTADEENSLMAGLDRVKGPHWSQILAMFGPGGTINEVLKDRNQVQLKDKARNLKLFFLKSGIEVPYYLQFVTGELKTRAPAQAAKNEAKEKEAHNEDRAHIEGVMALAGGSTQEGDQPAHDQDGNPSQNGVVPTANMGNNFEPMEQNGNNVKVGLESHGANDQLRDVNSPADGFGPIIMQAFGNEQRPAFPANGDIGGPFGNGPENSQRAVGHIT